MRKNLIRCPNCHEQGTTSILGEVTGDGAFSIMRFHNGYTKVVGNDFGVVCGNCEEPVYIKKGGGTNGTIRGVWQSWVYRQTFGEETASQGTQGSQA